MNPKGFRGYSRSPTVGNPIASLLTRNVWGIPVLNPDSDFFGFPIGGAQSQTCRSPIKHEPFDGSVASGLSQVILGSSLNLAPF